MPVIHTSEELIAALHSGAYVWPGGYPLYFMCNDGESLCFHCCKKEQQRECQRIVDADQQRVIVCDINYEDELYCVECNERIEAAYCDPVIQKIIQTMSR